MSLRLRLGLSFALVAMTTSLVMVLAMPVVIRYGFEPVLPAPTPLPGTTADPNASVDASASDGPGSAGTTTPGAATRGPSAGPNTEPSPPGPNGPGSSTPTPTSPPSGSPPPPPTASPGQPGGPSAQPSHSPSPQPSGSAIQSGRPSAPGGPGGTGGRATQSPAANGVSTASGQPAAGQGGSIRAGAPAVLAAARLHAEGSPAPDADASPGQPSASASGDPVNLAWVEVERRTSTILVVVAVLSGILSIAIGLILAEALIRPLRVLGRAASALAGGDLARRSGVGDRRDEIGELGRSFDTMAEALEQADASRRRFLQDAAHELGTPVTAIQTTVSAILDGVYEPERQHLETIRDEARLLGRIVSDLRTIALAEVRQLPIQAIDVDVAKAAASTADAFAAAAAVGGRRVVAEGTGPVMAIGDPDRIRQVLAALVDNALRHVPDGGEVRIRVTLDAGRVLAQILDDGPGLGDHADRVFDRFYRADAAPDRTAGHAGLGLAIVRALVEAQGGRVSAANRPEGGAVFRVELPAGGRPGAAGSAGQTPDTSSAS